MLKSDEQLDRIRITLESLATQISTTGGATEPDDNKRLQLISFWVQNIAPHERDPKERWWTFPIQSPVMGFFGTGPLMIVGDQPSTDSWPETHPSRVLLYGTLIELGVPNAHLTDVIKRRGRGSESCKALPSDFNRHLEIVRHEIDIVQPERIIALGACAERLLVEYLPRERHKIRKVWHFAYGARPGRGRGFMEQMRCAIS